MKWIQQNFKKIIYISFLLPIILVALVSISHVTKWYSISNPISWAVYLSVGIEVAALSALAAISAKMGKKVYFPFGIVTLIQFIGNIFFAYQFIDINNQVFKDWVDLVSPLVSYLGVEPTDMVSHKRFLAFFAGGMLPLISLSFLHMLVKFEESEKTEITVEEPKEIKELVAEEPPLQVKELEIKEPEIIVEDNNIVETIEETPEIANVETETDVQTEVMEEPQPIEEIMNVQEEQPKENDYSPKINRLSYSNRNG